MALIRLEELFDRWSNRAIPNRLRDCRRREKHEVRGIAGRNAAGEFRRGFTVSSFRPLVFHFSPLFLATFCRVLGTQSEDQRAESRNPVGLQRVSQGYRESTHTRTDDGFALGLFRCIGRTADHDWALWCDFVHRSDPPK